MSNFQKMFIGFTLAGLLAFAIMTFGVTLQQDNNANETLLENTLINSSYQSLQVNFNDMRNRSQTQRELFEEENPTVTFGSLILFSIVSSGKVFTNVMVQNFNILFKLPTALFGVNPVISSIMTTILLVSIIIALWVLYKLGG